MGMACRLSSSLHRATRMISRLLPSFSPISSRVKWCWVTRLTTRTGSGIMSQNAVAGLTSRQRPCAKAPSASRRGSTNSATSSSASLTNSNTSVESQRDTTSLVQPSRQWSNSLASASDCAIMSPRPRCLAPELQFLLTSRPGHYEHDGRKQGTDRSYPEQK